MKTCKKFFSLALVLLLCLAMAVPALAEGEGGTPTEPENKITLTVDDKGSEHIYNVYQIFTGDVYTGEGGELGLTNVKYGQNYGTNGTAVPEDILQGIVTTGAEQFAKKVMEETNKMAGVTPFDVLNPTDGYTAEVPAGYYLIVDMGTDGNGAVGDDDALSAYMVQILGDITIKPKTTIPTIDKEVANDEDGSFGTVADHDIGETFQFKLTANVPVDALAQYDTYRLVFHDTMSAGITFEGIDSVQVTGTDSNTAIPETDYTLTEPTEESNAFSLLIANLFQVIGETSTDWPVQILESDEKVVQVVVTYNVHLNEKAKVTNAGGAAVHENNKAHLEYSNDPNSDGIGETTEKETKVYSFQLDIMKRIDKEDGAALKGAGFTLYKEDTTTAIPLYYKVDADGNAAEDGIYYVWKDDPTKMPEDWKSVENNEIFTGDTGNLFIKGLDVGTYVLEETTIPEGFNDVDPITIVITASYGKDADGNTTLDLKHKENNKDAVDGTKIYVINKSGTLLPSTGGMGTTLLYVVGGLLVVGAAVILVVRKSVRRKS